MPFRWEWEEHRKILLLGMKWMLLAIPTGMLVGSAVALFLWLLDWATQTRFEHPWLLYFLPLAGVGISILYETLGGKSEAGNNLVIDEIYQPSTGVPLRMAPLVLLGTILTHLFGGSAGREGTAVQMGGSLAGTLGKVFGLSPRDCRTLLMAGIAAGFGAVFGTPLTGAVFALEVLVIGRMSYEALVPCLIASVVGDLTTTAWGISHTEYAIAEFAPSSNSIAGVKLDFMLTLKVAIAGVIFGLVSWLFAELMHSLQAMMKQWIRWSWLRPVVGGLAVILLVQLLGTSDYLGLGVSAPAGKSDAVTIVSCFQPGGAGYWSWWWKLLFTVVTLSCGFKGGEVTPLFFIGAALGNALAQLMGAPVGLFAGLGFVAVFAGATNTPLACTIMAIELFAPHSPGLFQSGFVVYAAIACFVAYAVSGHSGIYLSQRLPQRTSDGLAEEYTTLRQKRQ